MNTLNKIQPKITEHQSSPHIEDHNESFNNNKKNHINAVVHFTKKPKLCLNASRGSKKTYAKWENELLRAFIIKCVIGIGEV